MDAVWKAIEYRYDEDVFRRVIFTESHDEVANGRARVPEEIWPGRWTAGFPRSAPPWALHLFLLRPVSRCFFKGRSCWKIAGSRIKIPIDWSRVEDEHGILGMYRDLIALRRNLSGVTRGLCGQNFHIYHFDDEAKLIAFHRWDEQGPTDSVVVVVNMTNQNRDGYRHRFSAGRIVENAL